MNSIQRIQGVDLLSFQKFPRPQSNSKLKVFISQPMGGKTESQIKTERTILENKIMNYLGKNIEFLDTNFHFPSKSALFYLAKSLELLDQADVAFFAEKWENYRGCKIEHQCCVEYGIKRIYELNLKFD